MSTKRQPIIGNWYMNMTGQLIKVWAVGYDAGQAQKVIIEYLNGKKKVLGIEDWYLLDLEVHLYKSVLNKKQEEHQH